MYLIGDEKVGIAHLRSNRGVEAIESRNALGAEAKQILHSHFRALL